MSLRKGVFNMTIVEIVQQIEAIRAEYENGNLTSDDMSEHLEDLCIDIKNSNDLLDFESDDDYYQSFEETDFTKMEIV
tara:strand:+ start:769 stop:1002 length:234 start_codon:yes stop_codon:yes gene_type:complete